MNDKLHTLPRHAASGSLLRKATQPLLLVKDTPSPDYRNALVLVDFSPSSDAALHAALRLAPRATVHLLHAFEVPFEGKLRLAGLGSDAVAQYRHRQHAHALQRMDALLSEVQGERHRIRATVEHGDIRLRAPRAMQAVRPDLVAIGKQGRSMLQDLLLGSLTRLIVAEAQSDVLVIPIGAAC